MISPLFQAELFLRRSVEVLLTCFWDSETSSSELHWFPFVFFWSLWDFEMYDSVCAMQQLRGPRVQTRQWEGRSSLRSPSPFSPLIVFTSGIFMFPLQPCVIYTSIRSETHRLFFFFHLATAVYGHMLRHVLRLWSVATLRYKLTQDNPGNELPRDTRGCGYASHDEV